MADRGDTHYRVGTLNQWFAVSSLILLLISVWTVIDDYDRPWKNYQREFRALDLEKTKTNLESERMEAQAADEQRLLAEVSAAERALEPKKGEIAAVEARIVELRGALFTADNAAKFAKATYDWERYLVDEHRLRHDDPTYGQDVLDRTYQHMTDAALEKERATLALDQARAELAEIERVENEARKALKASIKDLELARQKLAKLQPTGAVAVAEKLRDMPGLDFVGPNLKVAKVVLPDLTFELNFTKKRRIDMCMTCHVGIDRAGYEEQEQPYATHPRLDLYLTARSPHPLKDVGCTICHRGAGEALDFVRVDHRPSSEEESAEWEQSHDWHKQHHWDYPMLASDYTEAGCVQCHKTSMELIAPEAPRVSAGYQLFERYGCYACHKVEWYPTKRKPGPTLANLAAKLEPEFVAAWIAAPRSFRPSTWMPQIFHLENFGAEEPVVKSGWGEGREILGREWNDAAVGAITTYLFEHHPERALPAAPGGGDALRGKETFRLAGCLACHNLAPYDGAQQPVSGGDLALERRGTNETGPNLRGVATKVDPGWLYWWIKDPAALWPETRMPNLRLSDQEAADVVAYLTEDPDGIFRDVPAGWKTGRPEMEPAARLETLQEQARWFFLRDGREELERRFRGEVPERRWDREQDLMVAVGEKLVLNQGCYSCHEISGMETTMPIGVELTEWGSKPVEKLDFGFVPEIKARQLGWDHHEIKNYLSYREGWIEQKLHAPRSYDLEKVKNPTEKLRMPWFDFTDEQVKSIATFVVGLVKDEVQLARMEPNAAQIAMDHGLRVIRQKNCAACHVLEPGTVTFREEGGDLRTVAAEVQTLEGEALPPRSDRFDEHLADYLSYMREDDPEFELEELGLRLLRAEPGLGPVGKSIAVPVEGTVVHPPHGGDFVRLVVDWYANPFVYGEDDQETSRTPDPDGGVGDVDGVWRKYDEEPWDKLRWTFAPPVLVGEGKKVRRDWFFSFLKDPVPLRKQMRVRMPTFAWEEGEAGAVADYFANRAAKDWPAWFARRLRVAQGLGLEDVARGSGLTAAAVAGIERGDQTDTAAGLSKLLAFAATRGYGPNPGPVDPRYEQLVRRSASHLGPELAANPAHLLDGERLAREGPGCFACHFYRGAPPTNELPVAWAPDLEHTRERLREDWTLEWLRDPAQIYPGTAMPANFPPGMVQNQQILPDTSSERQIEYILDWIYNLDRLGLPAGL